MKPRVNYSSSEYSTISLSTEEEDIGVGRDCHSLSLYSPRNQSSVTCTSLSANGQLNYPCYLCSGPNFKIDKTATNQSNIGKVGGKFPYKCICSRRGAPLVDQPASGFTNAQYKHSPEPFIFISTSTVLFLHRLISLLLLLIMLGLLGAEIHMRGGQAGWTMSPGELNMIEENVSPVASSMGFFVPASVTLVLQRASIALAFQHWFMHALAHMDDIQSHITERWVRRSHRFFLMIREAWFAIWWAYIGAWIALTAPPISPGSASSSILLDGTTLFIIFLLFWQCIFGFLAELRLFCVNHGRDECEYDNGYSSSRYSGSTGTCTCSMSDITYGSSTNDCEKTVCESISSTSSSSNYRISSFNSTSSGSQKSLDDSAVTLTTSFPRTLTHACSFSVGMPRRDGNTGAG